MARTFKSEWSRPDGWHITKRMDRKARQPQRDRVAFDADLAADAEAQEASYTPKVA